MNVCYGFVCQPTRLVMDASVECDGTLATSSHNRCCQVNEGDAVGWLAASLLACQAGRVEAAGAAHFPLTYLPMYPVGPTTSTLIWFAGFDL